MTDIAYGIDFGTTNSTVTAVHSTGDVQRLDIDPISFDKAVTRSVIYIDHRYKMTFGQHAVDTYLTDIAEGRIAQRKQIFTGKHIKIASPANSGGFVPDQIVPELIEVEEGEGGRLIQSLKSALASEFIQEFHIFDTTYSVVDLITIYLNYLKKSADAITGKDVQKTIIGRPVNYVGSDNTLAVKRMTDAAYNAGFKEVIFEYEPIGAAYDYGISVDKDHTSLMFDFGGGTLDLTIMKFPEKIVLANSGIALGGDYINSEIFLSEIAPFFGSESTYGEKRLRVSRSIYDQLKNWYSISLMKTATFDKTLETIGYKHSDPRKLKALKSLVYNNLGFALYEKIDILKKELSSTQNSTISMDMFDIDFMKDISRQHFEKLLDEDLSRITTLIIDTLDEAKMESEEIDSIATTGGSSLIPVVQQLLQEMFGNKIKSTNAFTSVSTGLALRAYQEFYK